MASALRVDFSSALATAVVETASALLTLERPASRHEDTLSVEAAWAYMDCTSYAGQTRAVTALALVNVQRMAHEETPDPVFWPKIPEEELAERNRGKQLRSDSRDREDRTREGGGFGGGGKNGGGGDHHHRRGGDSGDGGGGGAFGAGVAQGAAEGATLSATTGAVAAALAEVKEGGGTAREDVQRGTARQPPPARLRPRARTTAR